MDASLASHREPSPALRPLALSAGGVAIVATVVAACVLILRGGVGAFDPRSAGGFLAITGATVVVTAAVFTAGWPLLHRRAAATAIERTSEPSPSVRQAAASPSPVESSSAIDRPTPGTTSPWPGARLVQRIERFERQGPDGVVVDAAVGRVVVRFAEGSRSAVAHVGFCPPFAATPRVTVSNECDGAEVDVAAPEVLPWGVRIECRLEEPSEEPLDVEVHLVAEPADDR